MIPLNWLLINWFSITSNGQLGALKPLEFLLSGDNDDYKNWPLLNARSVCSHIQKCSMAHDIWHCTKLTFTIWAAIKGAHWKLIIEEGNDEHKKPFSNLFFSSLTRPLKYRKMIIEMWIEFADGFSVNSHAIKYEQFKHRTSSTIAPPSPVSAKVHSPLTKRS